MSVGIFLFGQPVKELIQVDQTPKKVFVLGVYASAVHATWISQQGKSLVRALAVASEPYIFWTGENADRIIKQINLKPEIGILKPSLPTFNGPSGLALDKLILHPLGISREEAWLCDLVPHSCMNNGQKRAIERAYSPIQQKFNLPVPTVPEVPKKLSNPDRRGEIWKEFERSSANIIILLGDQPIKWFLRYIDDRWNVLSDFGDNSQSYGRLHQIKFKERKFYVLPLAHPRQIAKLGDSSKKWFEYHKQWLLQANNLF